MPMPQPRRTANIALHVKLTEEEAARLRALAEPRGGHMRRVVVDGMDALEERADLLRRMTEAEARAVAAAAAAAERRSSTETWKTACSSILEVLKGAAAKRALTPTELEIWTLAMGLETTPP